MKRLTIKDIAKEFSVSISTVRSFVIVPKTERPAPARISGPKAGNPVKDVQEFEHALRDARHDSIKLYYESLRSIRTKTPLNICGLWDDPA